MASSFAKSVGLAAKNVAEKVGRATMTKAEVASGSYQMKPRFARTGASASLLKAGTYGAPEGMDDLADEVVDNVPMIKGFFAVFGLVLFLGGLSLFIVDFAMPPLAWPYHGLFVTIATYLPYEGAQYTSWNISIPFHAIMTVVGAALLILLVPPVFYEMYVVAYESYGINGYYTAISVLADVPVMFFAMQLANVQDFEELAPLVFVEIARIIFVHMFVVANRMRILRFKQVGHLPGPVRDIPYEVQWLGFAASFIMWIWVFVQLSTYTILSLQLWGTNTANPRYALVFSVYVFYGFFRFVEYLVLALRYTDTSAGASLRKFHVYDPIQVFISKFIPTVVLGVCLLIPAVMTGYCPAAAAAVKACV